MVDLFPVTLEEQIAEVEREIAMRKHVYPERIAARKLSAIKADKQMAALEAVSRTLNSLRGKA